MNFSCFHPSRSWILLRAIDKSSFYTCSESLRLKIVRRRGTFFPTLAKDVFGLKRLSTLGTQQAKEPPAMFRVASYEYYVWGCGLLSRWRAKRRSSDGARRRWRYGGKEQSKRQVVSCSCETSPPATRLSALRKDVAKSKPVTLSHYINIPPTYTFTLLHKRHSRNCSSHGETYWFRNTTEGAAADATEEPTAHRSTDLHRRTRGTACAPEHRSSPKDQRSRLCTGAPIFTEGLHSPSSELEDYTNSSHDSQISAGRRYTATKKIHCLKKSEEEQLQTTENRPATHTPENNTEEPNPAT